ncbi:MAG: TetR family transcriptional regulator [Bacilli bacterium]|nr:TetR family transcriptional regulator [Bacilli bacterium]
MPSDTFLNLREDKKKRLIDAAMTEFSAHLLEDASINQIIKNAGISRGSFYMYFKDKEDIYGYLLSRYKEKLHKSIFTNLEKNEGDFIKAWHAVFIEIIDFCKHAKEASFFKNIFLNLRFSNEQQFHFKPSKEEKEKWNKKVLDAICKKHYKTEDKDELLDAFLFVMMMTHMSVVHTFVHQDNAEEEKKKYENRLKWFQQGLYKEEEK